ncbi:MAG: hypothetical protein H6723_08205 [Sandaracinus sp.]|nr:hypothetical protein [Sandaracinus sp.]
MNEGSAGPVPTPSHWARVQLAAGQSGAGLWDLSSQVPEARVTVGAGPDAGWNVQGAGVAPVHFELYWDGSSLWVSPPMAGGLTVDGERVQSWRQLTGRCRIEFGQAAMLVESSQSVGLAVPTAAPSQPPQQGFMAPGDDSTMMAQGSPITGELDMGDLSPIAGESTMIFDGDAGFDLEGEATRMLDPGMPPPGPAAPAPPGAAARPVLGGSGGPSTARGAPTLTPFTMTTPPAPPPGGGVPMKTQILDASDLGLVPPAAFDDETRPPLGASQAETDVLPRHPSGSSSAATGKFAMPPSGADAPTATSKFQLPPVRTLVLLGVTLVIALGGLGLILWRKSQRQAAAQEAAQAAESNQAGQAEAAAAAVRLRIETAQTAQREAEARILAQAEPRITAALTAARTAAEAATPRDATPEAAAAALVTAERDALEKLGVEALGNNDYALSFSCFQRLAREHPGGPYAAMVPILRAKLPCTGGIGPDGRPCTR